MKGNETQIHKLNRRQKSNRIIFIVEVDSQDLIHLDNQIFGPL